MIKTFAIYLIMSIFMVDIGKTKTTEWKSNASLRRNPSAVVLNEKVKIQDEIKLLLNGELAATGDCNPEVKLGLIKKNNLNTWDTIVDITKLATHLCGLDRHIWSNDTNATSLLNYRFISHFKKVQEGYATYSFTYLVFKRNKPFICRTNEFIITY